MLNFSKPKPLHAKLWQDAGFDYILVEDSVRREKLKAVKAKPQTTTIGKVPQLNTATQSQGHGFVDNKEPQALKQTQHVFSAGNNDSMGVPTVMPKQSSPRSSEEAREIIESKTSLIDGILPEYEWSDEWKTIWNRIVRDQNPKVAWTYTGLHPDLFDGAQKSLERRTLINKIVKELGRPGGTHVFIPYDKCEESGALMLFKDRSFFWSAVARLKVRHILVFGSHARDELELPNRNVHSSFIYKGYKIYLLNDINRLITAKSDGKDLLAYIDSQLSSVNL